MIIISLGSNITSRWGSPCNTILHALRVLNGMGITILRYSALYCTAPYGIVDQPVFINAAAAIRTALPPAALLLVLKKIEAKAGRKRTQRWGPRALDIDIIDYNALIMNWHSTTKRHDKNHKNRIPRLILPHPEIQSRAFVVQPLLEIAPTWHHPVSGRSAAQLNSRLRFSEGGRILQVIGHRQL